MYNSSVHLLADKHLSVLSTTAIVNRATVNIGVQMSLIFSLARDQAVRLKDRIT